MQLRALAIEGAGAGVWEWNARRDEISTSAVVEDALGLTAGDLNTRFADWVDHVHPSDRERMKLVLNAIREKGEGQISMDLRLRRSDSSYRWFELEAASVPMGDARVLRCVGLLRDVTEVKRAHERLVQDAVTDTLTSLPNRRLFVDRLRGAFARALEVSGERPIVLLIDVDRFKNVNSGFGLIVGDSMLLTIARRLARHLGPRDTLARVGGDQFAVLIERDMDVRLVAQLAERVRRSLRAPVKIRGKEIVLTGSIGIARFDGEQEGHEDLLREAESAMYRAKRAGSDRIEMFKPDMRAEKNDRLTRETELRRAIERRQFILQFQPIVSLGNTELAGFEALVRWEHPRKGLVGPAEFIPLAEELDLIVPIGAYVLENAVREAGRWQRLLPRTQDPLFVSVNLSSRQFFRQDLIQEIRSILRRETVERNGLRLEVTETLAMENPEQAVEILERLREAGAGIAIDDFGTGYSSLAYLHRFPFDTIKIDKALVQNHGVDGPGGAIIRSVVALAHELGKTVVAEGVETYEDAVALKAMGCHYAQGFFFGEPMADRAVNDVLKRLARQERANNRGSVLDGAIDLFRTRRIGKGDGGKARAPVEMEPDAPMLPQPDDAAPASDAQSPPIAAAAQMHDGPAGDAATTPPPRPNGRNGGDPRSVPPAQQDRSEAYVPPPGRSGQGAPAPAPHVAHTDDRATPPPSPAAPPRPSQGPAAPRSTPGPSAHGSRPPEATPAESRPAPAPAPNTAAPSAASREAPTNGAVPPSRPPAPAFTPAGNGQAAPHAQGRPEMPPPRHGGPADAPVRPAERAPKPPTPSAPPHGGGVAPARTVAPVPTTRPLTRPGPVPGPGPGAVPGAAPTPGSQPGAAGPAAGAGNGNGGAAPPPRHACPVRATARADTTARCDAGPGLTGSGTTCAFA